MGRTYYLQKGEGMSTARLSENFKYSDPWDRECAWEDYINRNEEWRPEPESAGSEPVSVQWHSCTIDMNLRVA
jgi:hypothetical protein